MNSYEERKVSRKLSLCKLSKIIETFILKIVFVNETHYLDDAKENYF